MASTNKTKMKYTVRVQEVWIQPVEIEAESPEDAKLKVSNMEGNQIENRFEFCFTRDKANWQVDEVKWNAP